jgi:acyl-CoA reductase-like NAD-dependent aldehyde dehydrogenase
MSRTTTLRAVSPIDGQVVAERPLATQSEIDAALGGARRAQTAWAAASVAERAATCSRFVAAIAIGERVETGTFFMNRCDYLDPALAWTGVKDSGRGCTLSRVGFETLTRPKSFHLRALKPPRLDT